MLKETGFKGNILWDQTKPDGTFRKVLDVGRIDKLGWKAKISLSEGIRKTIFEYNQSKNQLNKFL